MKSRHQHHNKQIDTYRPNRDVYELLTPDEIVSRLKDIPEELFNPEKSREMIERLEKAKKINTIYSILQRMIQEGIYPQAIVMNCILKKLHYLQEDHSRIISFYNLACAKESNADTHAIMMGICANNFEIISLVYNHALKTKQLNQDIFANMLEITIRNKKENIMIEIYNHALKYSLTNCEMHESMMRYFGLNKNIEKVRQVFEYAIKSNEFRASTLHYMVDIYLHLRKYAEALKIMTDHHIVPNFELTQTNTHFVNLKSFMYGSAYLVLNEFINQQKNAFQLTIQYDEKGYRDYKGRAEVKLALLDVLKNCDVFNISQKPGLVEVHITPVAVKEYKPNLFQQVVNKRKNDDENGHGNKRDVRRKVEFKAERKVEYKA